MCVSVCVCMCVCARARVHACLHAFIYACMHSHSPSGVQDAAWWAWERFVAVQGSKLKVNLYTLRVSSLGDPKFVGTRAHMSQEVSFRGSLFT